MGEEAGKDSVQFSLKTTHVLKHMYGSSLGLSLSPFPYTNRLLITFTNPTLITPQSQTTQKGRATNPWNNSHIVIAVSVNVWNFWMQIAGLHIQSPYLL